MTMDMKKPTAPMIYTVSKGANVWPSQETLERFLRWISFGRLCRANVPEESR